MAYWWLRVHPMCTCALTQRPLSYTGRDKDAGALHTPREVTIHTLSDYVSKVAQLWLQVGVARQAAAFRTGIEDLCSSPEILLAPFTLPELQTTLWNQHDRPLVGGRAACRAPAGGSVHERVSHVCASPECH
jgi:hypothetical protein